MTTPMDGLSGQSTDNLMDHGDLSAIAEFNKAHDASQQSSTPVEPPQPVVQPPPIKEQPPKPAAVASAPVTPTVDRTPPQQPLTPLHLPSQPKPATPTASLAATPAPTNNLKRPAEGPPEAVVSPIKRQYVPPQQPQPATPRTQTREQSVASQTSASNGHQWRNGSSPDRDQVDEYGTDSDDDFEKHPPNDSLAAGSGYSFANAFSNGQLLDPSQHLRIHSLPILENLSSQLLNTLLQGQYQDTLITVTQPDTDQGQAYATLKALFLQTKRVYSTDAFLSTDELKFQMPEHRNMVRKVNLATFISSLFGSTEVGFFHLNENFLHTFVPEGGRLLKNQGNLFLDLKTQAFISALDQAEKSKEQVLDDLFEQDIGGKLMDRRGGSKELIPSEVDFIGRVKNRRDTLEIAPADVSVLRELYPWQNFLKEMILYVAKHKDSILAPTTRKKLKRLEAAQADSSKHMFQAHTQTPNSAYGQHASMYMPPGLSQPVYPGYSSVGRPSMHAYSSTGGAAAGAMDQTSLSGSTPNPALSMGTSQALTAHPEQTTPTHILYEQARLAATARQSPNARRAGLPSQRRPWSTEEERALMAGLDCVKGPHWSQILAMFGAGGTVSEALKDRNQVQLKDKARNLKLFFLKSGMEVPYYLQFVTGELKTRAPGQVAKNEKRKQQEQEANQNRATVDALNALTGGSSNGESSQSAMARGPQHGHSQPPQAPRLQPTHVPTPHPQNPQRWAMSQAQPQPQPQPQPQTQSHVGVAAPKVEQTVTATITPHAQPPIIHTQQSQAPLAPQAPQPPMQAAQPQPAKPIVSAT
ncbi:hypothetical protein ABW19_dt0210099 [Dactylella cylindrospora]|nr:hypothetical protein ABW19_dt0210099 [Dactylella cylindrospora]